MLSFELLSKYADVHNLSHSHTHARTHTSVFPAMFYKTQGHLLAGFTRNDPWTHQLYHFYLYKAVLASLCFK